MAKYDSTYSVTTGTGSLSQACADLTELINTIDTGSGIIDADILPINKGKYFQGYVIYKSGTG